MPPFQKQNPAPAATAGVDMLQVDATTGEIAQDPPSWSVSQLNSAAAKMLEGQFSRIAVVGEVAGFRSYQSGHWYFSLKDPDDGSEISAVMFKNSQRSSNYSPADGELVEARGRVTIYKQRGTYQIILSSIDPLGEGALLRQLEELKRKLDNEGLFAEHNKLAIPAPPQHIAIITSASADALQDVCKVLTRRAAITPATHIHSAVQGPDAPQQLIAALDRIETFNSTAAKVAKQPIDLILMVRGGGSISDLWAFNDETLARRIFACRVPVITGVGHEPDTTLVDYVSDRRAATPSVAAQIASETQAGWQDSTRDYAQRLRQYIGPIVESAEQALDTAEQELGDVGQNYHHSLSSQLAHIAQLIAAKSPSVLIERQSAVLQTCAEQLLSRRPKVAQLHQNLDNLQSLAGAGFRQRLQDCTSRLAMAHTQLQERHWKKPLERGYAMAMGSDGKVVSSAKDAAGKDVLRVLFHDAEMATKPTGKLTPSDLLNDLGQ